MKDLTPIALVPIALAFVGDRGARDVAAQPFELLALVGAAAHPGKNGLFQKSSLFPIAQAFNLKGN